MHPARLSFLSVKHKQRRKIDLRTRDAKGHWAIVMQCGHEGTCVGHFDISKETHWNCVECGEAYVRSAPEYAREF